MVRLSLSVEVGVERWPATSVNHPLLVDREKRAARKKRERAGKARTHWADFSPILVPFLKNLEMNLSKLIFKIGLFSITLVRVMCINVTQLDY
jgi:hypothetical protein